jgi:hypothetical protein
MSHLSKFAFIGLLALSSGAFADGNERQICGQPLKTDGSLSWSAFNKTPLPESEPKVYEALEQVLAERAATWSPVVREPVLSAFQDLKVDKFKEADFDLVTLQNDPNSTRPRQFAFLFTSQELELPINEVSPLCRDANEKRSRVEAGNFVLLVKRALKGFRQGDYLATVAKIKKLEEQYDRYLFDGFPMFPWEAWANSRFLTDKNIANGPPKNMLVLIHPSAGLVTSIDSDTSSDTGGVLAVEAVGWIRYSTNYRHWYGASLLAVFPTDRDIGYGVAFNYDNFKLGVTWHDDNDSEHDGLALFFGFDLYQLVSDKKKSFEDYRDALKALSEKPTNN